MPSPPASVVDYRVGWICAVEVEFVVACELLDEEYSGRPRDLPMNDSNAYAYGKIGQHHVVIACLPKGVYGTVSAASVALEMQRSFPSLRIRLMVGIGGGAPSEKNDIRLGDVVVSTPGRRSRGVVHYEFGKTIQNRAFEITGSLDGPPVMLLTALSNLSRRHIQRGHAIQETIDTMIRRNARLRRYEKPNPETDVLYLSSFVHSNDEQMCDRICVHHCTQIHPRKPRPEATDDPIIHYGLIASADHLMKDATVRDRLTASEGVLCFEMEAAGLMGRFPCVVIRGICDYSDSHKNDDWQAYAAATAAAYAKELLQIIPAYEVESISDLSTGTGLSERQDSSLPTTTVLSSQDRRPMFLSPAQQAATLDIVRARAPEVASMLCNKYWKSFQHYNYEKALEIQAGHCHSGSCQWIMQNKKFRQWAGSHKPCLLWINGPCGTGKSTLAAHIVQALDTELAQDTSAALILYTFFDVRRNNNASAMLCTMMHQLLTADERFRDIAFTIDSNRTSSVKQHQRPAVQLAWVMQKILQIGIVPNVCIIVDGLNFCNPDDQKILLSFAHQLPAGTRCLFTGRSSKSLQFSTPESAVVDNLTEIVLQLDTDKTACENLREDIDSFAKHQIYNTAPFSDLSTYKKSAIFSYLRGRADSTFLVTHFTIDKLRRVNLSNDMELEKVLRLQLFDHAQLYISFLRTVVDTEGSIIRHVLKYVLYSPEAPSIREIAYAYNRETSCDIIQATGKIRQVLNQLNPLLIKHHGSERVDVWHPSVREVMVDHLSSLPQHDQFSLPLADSYQGMAIDCLSLLIESSGLDFPEQDRVFVGEQLRQFLKTHDRLWYALRNWYTYLRSAAQSIDSPQDIQPELTDLVGRLGALWSSPRTLKFRHLLCLLGRVKNIDSRLYLTTFELICALGLTVFVRAAIDRSSLKSSAGRFDFRIELALMLSVAGGHTQTAKMLLERYNITSLDGAAYSGILENAAAQGQPELLEILLRMRKRDPKEVQKASEAAFATGNLATLNVLRREHAFQDRDEWGSTVLHSEFQHGKGPDLSDADCTAHMARMQLLINDQHIDVHAREGVFGNSALHLACWYGYPTKILEELIRLGANPKALNTFKWTPLHLAARYARQEESIDLLFSVGGSEMAGMVTRGGNSALHWAALPGRIHTNHSMNLSTEVVRKLLQAGCDPHLKNARGEVAWSIAATDAFSLGVVQTVHTRLDRITAPRTPEETDDDLDLDLQHFNNRHLFGGYGVDSDSDALGARPQNPQPRREPVPAPRPTTTRPPATEQSSRTPPRTQARRPPMQELHPNTQARATFSSPPSDAESSHSWQRVDASTRSCEEPTDDDDGEEDVVPSSGKGFRQRWKWFFPTTGQTKKYRSTGQ